MISQTQKGKALLATLAISGLSMAAIAGGVGTAYAAEVSEIAAQTTTPAAATQTGTWGTADWSFENGILTIGAGALGSYYSGPTYPYASTEVPLEDIQKIIFSDPTNTQFNSEASYYFQDLPYLTDIEGIGQVDVSGVTNFTQMFNNSPMLGSMDLSGWDVSNATTMDRMFRDTSALTSLGDISGWKTGKVTTMSGMFFNATGLTDLDLSGWDTSAVTDMHGMFQATTLADLSFVSGWNTSSVMDLHQMFAANTAMTGLDLSRWDVSNVTDMESMFMYTYSLDELDLSGWDTSSAETMTDMLTGTPVLQTLILGSKTALASDAGLGNKAADDQFTGKWVGLGQIQDNGAWWRGTAAELQSRSQDENTAAGTYTWQEAASVIFDLNNGEWGANEPTFVPEDTITGVGDLVEYGDPIRSGYEFDGWAITTNDGDNNAATARADTDSRLLITEPGVTTFTAQWKAEEEPVPPTEPGGGTDKPEPGTGEPGTGEPGSETDKPGSEELAQTGADIAIWLFSVLGLAAAAGTLLAARKKFTN